MRCEMANVVQIIPCDLSELAGSTMPLMTTGNVFKMFGKVLLARRDYFGVPALSTT